MVLDQGNYGMHVYVCMYRPLGIGTCSVGPSREVVLTSHTFRHHPYMNCSEGVALLSLQAIIFGILLATTH